MNVGIYVQECGPSFTLKLVTLQHGTFDTKGGEFEWVHKVKKNHHKIILLLLCALMLLLLLVII